MATDLMSVSSLITNADHALQQGDINSALVKVHNFVETVITNPVCTSQVVASRGLDSLCMRIGRRQLACLSGSPISPPWRDSHAPIIIYLVSRIQRSGGHSRLLQDFIRAQPGKNHLILSTEIAGPSDADYFSEIFAEEGNVLFIRAPRGDFRARLAWLQRFLISIRPLHVYLFNHHQDSVAVSALVPDLETVGTFCHHGDHHLSLGVYLTHLTHLDLHPMGFHCCRGDLGLENQYLPLTFECKSSRIKAEYVSRNDTGLITATAARYNKIEVPYYVSYLDLIPEVLAITNGRHLHIGKLSPWGLRRLRYNLTRRGIKPDKFIYLEWTPSVSQALEANHVDVYLASFPYGAALTLIEVMAAGVPVILHRHLYSRVLSCLELAYPEAFSWAHPQELLSHLTTLTLERIRYEGELARKRYSKYHSPEILKDYFDPHKQACLSIPELCVDFYPRHDEWAAWVESQMTWFNLFRMNAFRFLRRLRRMRIC